MTDVLEGTTPHLGPEDPLALTRRAPRLHPDRRRVVAGLFAPAEEEPGSLSRASLVIDRIMALDDDAVDRAYAQTLTGFAGRHRDLEGIFADHFQRVGREYGAEVSDQRRLLIGAYFTHEYAIEGAALTNPSMVEHPDQSGLAEGELRFVISARGIGEGHVSCIEFRTGVIGADGDVVVDQPSPFAQTGGVREPLYDRAWFEAALTESGDGDAHISPLLSNGLPERFTRPELEQWLAGFAPSAATADLIRRVADCQYVLEFTDDTALSERVLRPVAPSECRGMEDARFVRFTGADGNSGYRATYTAYDGVSGAPQLIETADFRTFHVSQLHGPAARNKGLALFPRLIGGVHVALSRWDRESTSLASSPDGLVWGEPRTLRMPELSWELVQNGNCGSPIETPDGWLVLTHGVGPMRAYGIGVLLLDLDEPQKVIGVLAEPLLTADADERDGYVPNVVYSCGALQHGEHLVIPYGFSDVGIGFATVGIPELIGRMRQR